MKPSRRLLLGGFIGFVPPASLMVPVEAQEFPLKADIRSKDVVENSADNW
jgi:hypothetical protein